MVLHAGDVVRRRGRTVRCPQGDVDDLCLLIHRFPVGGHCLARGVCRYHLLHLGTGCPRVRSQGCQKGTHMHTAGEPALLMFSRPNGYMRLVTHANKRLTFMTLIVHHIIYSYCSTWAVFVYTPVHSAVCGHPNQAHTGNKSDVTARVWGTYLILSLRRRQLAGPDLLLVLRIPRCLPRRSLPPNALSLY